MQSSLRFLCFNRRVRVRCKPHCSGLLDDPISLFLLVNLSLVLKFGSFFVGAWWD